MLHYLAILTAAIGVSPATPQSPEWHTDYGKALSQTRTDDRPLLMVIDNPADETARIAPELLNSDQAVEALAPYDLCHIDATTQYGKKVAEAFKTDQFPYVAFVDKSGSVILHSRSGELAGDQWNALLAKYKNGEKPVRREVNKPAVDSGPAHVYEQGSYPQQFSPRPYCAKCQLGY